MENAKKNLLAIEKGLEGPVTENFQKIQKFNLDDLKHIMGGEGTTTSPGDSTKGSAYIVIEDCW